MDFSHLDSFTNTYLSQQTKNNTQSNSKIRGEASLNRDLDDISNAEQEGQESNFMEDGTRKCNHTCKDKNR